MISVDISAIEELKTVINKASSDSSDILAILKRVFEEMNEDVELKTHIQYDSANESVAAAIDSLNKTEQRLQTLKGILSTVNEEYCEIENESVNAIRRMADYLSKYKSQHLQDNF